jgi:hypothetical protein
MDASVLAAARGAMLSMMLLRASGSMCISLLAALLEPISAANQKTEYEDAFLTHQQQQPTVATTRICICTESSVTRKHDR